MTSDSSSTLRATERTPRSGPPQAGPMTPSAPSRSGEGEVPPPAQPVDRNAGDIYHQASGQAGNPSTPRVWGEGSAAARPGRQTASALTGGSLPPVVSAQTVRPGREHSSQPLLDVGLAVAPVPAELDVRIAPERVDSRTQDTGSVSHSATSAAVRRRSVVTSPTRTDDRLDDLAGRDCFATPASMTRPRGSRTRTTSSARSWRSRSQTARRSSERSTIHPMGLAELRGVLVREHEWRVQHGLVERLGECPSESLT